MPLEAIDPLFLVPPIEFEYVSGAGALVAAGFAALWRAQRQDLAGVRTESKESWAAVRDALAANAKLLEIQKAQEQTAALQSAAMAQQQQAISHLLELQGTSVASRADIMKKVDRDIEEIKSLLRVIDSGNHEILRVMGEAKRATG